MFDSLDDQMKADLNRESTGKERLLRYAAVAVASVLLFGGLIYSVHFFESTAGASLFASPLLKTCNFSALSW